MRAGSITKTLTSIAVMQLVEQGRFSLATPVRELLPEAPIVNPWEATDPVRVVHLLEHTAGFDDTSLSRLFSPVETQEGHLKAVLADPRPLRVRWRPGQMMSYANPGYAVLGALLEKQTGQSWEALMRRKVLEPLGMTQSVLTIAEAVKQDHALGYRKGKVPLLFMPDRAAGALWTTPGDLSKVGSFLLSDGASAPGVLRPETVGELKKVHSTAAARAGLNWGYSLGLQRSSAYDAEWLGHFGSVHGAAAILQTQPQRGLGYVVMVNTESVGELADPLVGYIVGQAEVPKNVSPGVAITGQVEGWFRRRDHRPELLAGINWLFGVMRVERDPKDPTTLHFQDALRMDPPIRFSSPDNGLLTGKKLGFTKSALIREGDRVVAIDNNGSYFERVSAFSALAPMPVLGLSLVALMTAPFGRRKRLANPWLRRLPTLALLTLITLLALTSQLEITTVGRVHAITLAIFLGTLVFPILAISGVVMSLRHWTSEPARVARWRCLLGSLGALGLSVFFACFHWFGLALWRW
jgi:CubicO group peptidase (beta-lactamase class C family)